MPTFILIKNYKLLSKRPTDFLATIIFVLTILTNLFRTPEGAFYDCFMPYFTDIDFQEYHIIAVNLVKNNLLLINGYVSNINDYNICTTNYNDTIFKFINEVGPFPILTRPPFYPLFLGMIYYLFGIKTMPVFIAYFILSGLISTYIYKCLDLIFDRNYRIINMLFVLCFYNFLRPVDLIILGPEQLTSFLLTLFIYYFIKIIKNKSYSSFFFLGMLFSVLLLTKGIFLLLAPIFFIYGLIKPRCLPSFILGALTLLFPWFLFINSFKNNNLNYIKESKTRVENWMPAIQFDNYSEYLKYAKDTNSANEILEFKIGHLYTLYLTVQDKILLTNQIVNETFFMVHNEYSIDGDVHFGWKQIKSSYYNNDIDTMSNLQRIFLFYFKNYELIPQIILNKLTIGLFIKPKIFISLLVLIITTLFFIEKLKLTFRLFLVFFSIMIAFFSSQSIAMLISMLSILITPYFILSFKEKYKILIFSCVQNCQLIALIFYGDERYFEIFNPIWFIGYILFAMNIILKNHEQRQFSKIN